MSGFKGMFKQAGKLLKEQLQKNATSSDRGQTIKNQGTRKNSSKIFSPNVRPEDFTKGKDFNFEKHKG